MCNKCDKIDPRITGTLENWRYSTLDNIVWGNIDYDVKGRFPDGTYIHTSYLPKYENWEPFDCKQGDLIYTRNSIYRLGKPANDI